MPLAQKRSPHYLSVTARGARFLIWLAVGIFVAGFLMMLAVLHG